MATRVYVGGQCTVKSEPVAAPAPAPKGGKTITEQPA